MKHWVHSIRVGLVLACVFTLTGAGLASAGQRTNVWTELGEEFLGASTSSDADAIVGDTFVLPTSGAEVVVAEGVSADDPSESDVPDQVIVTIPQGIGAVGVIQGLGNPEDVMETYASAFSESLDGGDVIDIQSDSNHAAGLYSVEVFGISVLMYITVDTTTLPGYFTIQVAVAEVDIAEAISLLRENVSLNGTPMFTGVDEQAVQDMADDFTGF